MSSAWVAGRVPDAPIDDILKAAIGIDTTGYGHQAVFWFPRRGGFQAVSDGIRSGIERSVRLDTPVTSVRRAGTRWRVNDEDFDLVVNTIPLPELERAMADIPDGLRAEIRALVPISLVNVLFGVATDTPPPDLSWIYLPFADQGPANRVTYFSNYSPENAPPGHASFMAEATYRGRLAVTEAWLDDLEGALARCGLFAPGSRVVRAFHQSKYAYIDQDLRFPQRIAAVRAWFDRSGLITFGRFGRYEYHNSDQCVARAFEVREFVRAAARSGNPPVVGFAPG
jgi:protoporphyrinogen oxidase